MSKSLGNSLNNSLNKKHFMSEFLSSWRLTWRYLRRDSGALLLLVAAGAFYAFFYPLPYSTEQIRRVPVAVVEVPQQAHRSRWHLACKGLPQWAHRL